MQVERKGSKGKGGKVEPALPELLLVCHALRGHLAFTTWLNKLLHTSANNNNTSSFQMKTLRLGV